jgi:hypothetical protein
MWPCFLKIQYTELKLSCGNDPVVKNYIFSNGDLDLWPNDPKINRVLSLHRGIMWPSVLKIQYTELKLSCGNDPVVKKYIYSNGDLDLWPNHPKINRVLPLPQGNHAAKFGKDPIIIHNTPSLLTINNTSSLLTINNTSVLVNHQQYIIFVNRHQYLRSC